ncbi:MAG: prolipoprotein diacylglyceryl transferase [Lachnospiraceae bacterium]|nr:prolipoprotein diacylglyceryl transferase [Lachnospiraceae bacterium]
MNLTDIRFPHLGILLKTVGSGISIGGFEIKYYGIIIASGFLLGLLAAMREAKRTGQNPDLYMDYLICMILPAIAGARLYYVIFSWDYYKNNLISIFMTRQGGLAIFGGVIAGVIVLILFSRWKKQPFFQMTDTIVMSLLIGQIMGRWGNFFNREAFGGFTDNLFAMQIPVGYFEQMGRLSEIEATGLLNKAVDVTLNGTTISCIQVHPTFLYESLWNLALLLLIFLYRKHKKFDGELFAIYLMGYGVGRFWIEGLRVDQLTIGSTGLAVSQILAAALAVGAVLTIIIVRTRLGKNK